MKQVKTTKQSKKKTSESVPKPAASKIPEQGFLFGEADKVRAALSSELGIINGEISSADERRINLMAKISELESRRKIVEDAMRAIDKAQGERPAARAEA